MPSETYGKGTTKTLLQTMQTGCVATAVYFEANAFGPNFYGHPMGSVYIFQKQLRVAAVQKYIPGVKKKSDTGYESFIVRK